jgi:hypothetical protein
MAQQEPVWLRHVYFQRDKNLVVLHALRQQILTKRPYGVAGMDFNPNVLK